VEKGTGEEEEVEVPIDAPPELLFPKLLLPVLVLEGLASVVCGGV
jgi:hypothetical protein